MGGPILILIFLGVLLMLPVSPASGAGRVIPIASVLLAILFGWRLAYHLHMRRADEYGGAYTRAEVYRRARVVYLVGSVVYAVAAAYLVHLAIEARGFDFPLPP